MPPLSFAPARRDAPPRRGAAAPRLVPAPPRAASGWRVAARPGAPVLLPAALAALAALAVLAATPAAADTVVASRTIRAAEILAPGDVELQPGETAGAATRLAEVLGLEARAILYAGRPVRPEQLGAPALVERNQKVTLVFASGGLRIEAEGRALGRAALGEDVSVMNLDSRRTVIGTVAADGSVNVGRDAR